MADNLLDSTPIAVTDVKEPNVVIQVPTIYVHTDEMNGSDKTTSNLRVINYDVLTDLTKIAMDINSVDKAALIEKCNYLINYLVQHMGDNISTSFMEFIKFSTEIGKNLDIEDDYLDITTEGISFDVIRRYEVCPNTRVLISAEPAIAQGIYQLYSQVPLDEHYNINIQNIRNEMNDTDLNRIHYCLLQFEKTLRFENGYIYSRILKLKCLALYYICLYMESNPLQNYCDNDLKGNMLSYILDCVVRSRVIQAWQRYPISKTLTHDISKNYNDRIHMIKLCQLPCARERAQYLIQIVRDKPEMQRYLQHINYDSYVSTLDKTKLVIENEEYYVFNNEFITSLAVNLSDLQSIQKLYENCNFPTQ